MAKGEGGGRGSVMTASIFTRQAGNKKTEDLKCLRSREIYDTAQAEKGKKGNQINQLKENT